MAPVRDKLNTKTIESAPSLSSKNYLKKLGAYNSIMIAKSARFLNPAVMRGTLVLLFSMRVFSH